MSLETALEIGASSNGCFSTVLTINYPSAWLPNGTIAKDIKDWLRVRAYPRL
jgi:hypothetical protein